MRPGTREDLNQRFASWAGDGGTPPDFHVPIGAKYIDDDGRVVEVIGGVLPLDHSRPVRKEDAFRDRTFTNTDWMRLHGPADVTIRLDRFARRVRSRPPRCAQVRRRGAARPREHRGRGQRRLSRAGPERPDEPDDLVRLPAVAVGRAA
jgi:hypothetical protein